jgi:uncharacterized protein YecE (DUF72 family)
VNRAGIIRVGTSGWHYSHWRGAFYDPKIAVKAQFEEYAKSFDTVELNNAFYKLPTANTVRIWKAKAPAGFLYAVKAHRFITHMKKLKSAKDSVDLFMDRISCLGRKLGPVLFQLPPKWNLNVSRLEEFVALLPKRQRFAFEFRNVSWYHQDVYDVLKKKNSALCIYELAGHHSPTVITADFVYVRLHGPGDKYQGSYTEGVLSDWARQCRTWRRAGLDVFVYFDNDQSGYAAFNALRLRQMLSS